MKDKNNVPEQNQNELKDDVGNPIQSTSGPNFDRIFIAVGICVALLILDKLLGL
jgi:hypothetical protein